MNSKEKIFSSSFAFIIKTQDIKIEIGERPNYDNYGYCG